MGDVGSTTLGFLFAVVPLNMNPEWRAQAVFAVIIALWLFISDGVFTLLKRLIRGEKIWRAHREHFYQKLVATGLSHREVVCKVAAVDGGLAILGVLSLRMGGVVPWAVVSIAIMSFLVYYRWVWKRVQKAGFSI
jgi:UDP-N-acetylmuramyl pentapeptide phosphotransferase/UDP-N-acetylglucosamine-1-phosphate transferase